MPKVPKSKESLKVHAFLKDTRQGSCKTFKFEINPDTINTSHKNKFSHLKGINTSGRNADYAYSHSDEMSLQLTLDDTLSTVFIGKELGSTTNGITAEVEDFLESCFYIDGDIHRPRFLRLEWGQISFDCRLKSINVSYTLFNADGNPLRAILDTVFVSDMADSKRVRLEDLRSPDVTHNRLILQGQTLTNLTKEIYGDASNYLTVAQANELDHFRRLKPGTNVQFPPLENNI